MVLSLIATVSWEGNMCKLGTHDLRKCSFSNEGSDLRIGFEVEGFARFEIEPLIGEISPCFVDEDGSVDGGSSNFISTSASTLTSGLSSCCSTTQLPFKLR